MSVGDENKNLGEKYETREQSRKPYTTPRLTVHGGVEEITQLCGAGTTDSIIGPPVNGLNCSIIVG